MKIRRVVVGACIFTGSFGVMVGWRAREARRAEEAAGRRAAETRLELAAQTTVKQKPPTVAVERGPTTAVAPAGVAPKTLAVAPVDAEEVARAAKELAAPGQAFFDPHYRVTGKIPEGWAMRDAPRWGKEETTLYLVDPEHPAASPSVYYRMFDAPMQLAGAEITTWLQEQAVAKAKSRVEAGITDYVNRDFIPRTIGERPALTWTAEYTRNGEPWVEYLTRVYSPNCTILFFLRVPAKDFPAVQPGFEAVIKSTIIP